MIKTCKKCRALRRRGLGRECYCLVGYKVVGDVYSPAPEAGTVCPKPLTYLDLARLVKRDGT